MANKKTLGIITIIVLCAVGLILIVFIPERSDLLSAGPSISLSGENVYVAWMSDEDNKIFFKKSEDSGESWSDDVRISSMFDVLPSNNLLSIASYEGNIFVVWDVRVEEDTSEIFFKKSEDGGESWSDDIRLTNAQKLSTHPIIEVSGKSVYLIWDDSRHDEEEITRNYQSDNWEIYFKKSEDGGESWSDDIRLTNAPMASWYSDIEIDGNDVYVVWSDWRTGTAEIFFKKSVDSGNTWSEDMKLTEHVNIPDPLSVSTDPKIKKINNTIYVIWSDWRTGISEIFLKKSDDLGRSWSENIKLTSLNQSVSNPAFVVDDKKIYLVSVSKSSLYLMEFDINNLALLRSEIISEITDYNIRPEIVQDDKYLYMVWGDAGSMFFKKIEK